MAKRTPDAVVRSRPRLDLKHGGQLTLFLAGVESTSVHRGNLSAMRSLHVSLRISLGDVKFRKLSLSLSKENSTISSRMLSW